MGAMRMNQNNELKVLKKQRESADSERSRSFVVCLLFALISLTCDHTVTLLAGSFLYFFLHNILSFFFVPVSALYFPFSALLTKHYVTLSLIRSSQSWLRVCTTLSLQCSIFQCTDVSTHTQKKIRWDSIFFSLSRSLPEVSPFETYQGLHVLKVRRNKAGVTGTLKRFLPHGEYCLSKTEGRSQYCVCAL